jgi:hypothetical protein
VKLQWQRHLVPLCLALALLLSGPSAWGQASTTSIYGEITDPQGAAVVGAKVTITHVATGVARTAETDSTGRYQFLALQPGKYNLKVEMSGFRTAVRENIELLVNTQTKLNISLVLGQITETVLVTEAAAALNTTNASVGSALSYSHISSLPLEGRNVAQLLSLQTGATFLPTEDMRSGSISGARSDQSTITLDGVDLNDPQSQTEAYKGALRISQEALQEFRVTTANADGSQGRSSGGQVSMISRSGSNEFHGGFFWYLRRTGTSSNEYFNKLRQIDDSQPNKPPRLDKNLFGGNFGGPIMRDRIFIYGSFEGNRQNYETSVTRSVPSQTLRDGILIYPCRNVGVNPACPTASTTVTGLSGATYTIPAGFYGASPAEMAAIDPQGIGPNLAGMAYFQNYPLPNAPGRDGRTVGGIFFGNIMGYAFGAPLRRAEYSLDVRADFKLDAAGNHTLFWKAILQDDFDATSPQFQNQPPNTTTLTNPKLSIIGLNSVLTPRLVNTFRYGYTFYKRENAGLQRQPVSSFRFLDTATGFTSTNKRVFQTHNLVDDVIWTYGAHNLQFGTNIRFTRLPRFTNAGAFHSAIANGSWVTGIGRTYEPGRGTCNTPGCTAIPGVSTGARAVWADTWMVYLGILSQINANFNFLRDGFRQPQGEFINRRYASNEFEFYAQDVWRWKSNLTITYGVRWALFSPPWETAGNQVAPTPSFSDFFDARYQAMLAGQPSNSVARTSFVLAGPANDRVGFYEWDLNNFSPRISVAWTPRSEWGLLDWLTGSGKMVVRAGYSLVYDRIGQALATTFDAGGSFGLAYRLTSPFGSCGEAVGSAGAPTACARFTGINTLPAHPLIDIPPPGTFPATPDFGLFAITTSIDDNLRTPYSHVLNLSVGRELPFNTAVEVGYVGRVGRKLLTKRDLAMPLDIVIGGRSYFQAASALAIAAETGDPTGFGVGLSPTQVATDPFWENLYPGMIGNPICDVYGLGAAAYTTATMAIYDLYLCVAPDYTTALQFIDQGQSPVDPVGLCQAFGSCSRFGAYTFFSDQWSSLAGQSSLGSSDYHSMQITVRKKMSHGLQFDFNYTWSHSIDLTSDVERGSNFGGFFAGGYSEFLVNSWNPRTNRGNSTFDIRHQINLNYVYELPIGRNKWIGKDMSTAMDHVLGGWSLNGVMRWTSGLPFSVINCRSCWPTNWNLQGNAGLFGPAPATGRFKDVFTSRVTRYPGVFPVVSAGGFGTNVSNPANPVSFFRRSRPGEVGLRNNFRGDGYYNWDMGVHKIFNVTERVKVQFRWEVFNVFNTVRFNTASLSLTPDLVSSFGRYGSTYATCDGAAGRCMQFAFRVEF